MVFKCNHYLYQMSYVNSITKWKYEERVMRRSNCSALIPPGSPGVRGKMCVIKKGGTLENKVKKGGVLENEGIKVIN